MIVPIGSKLPGDSPQDPIRNGVHLDAVPPSDILPMFGDPLLFADGWPDRPYRKIQSATGLRATCSWASIDRLLNDQALRVPAFRMAQDNRLLPLSAVTRSEQSTSLGLKGLADPARIVAEFGNGATLVLQGLQRFWPPLTDITRRLSSEIGHAVFVNAYLTPRSAQGFGAHHDPYHAWLMQTEGVKTWRLWAPRNDPEVDPPDLEIVLGEGDVLWIPRGWWHAGKSGAQPSLHLTFTVWATKLAEVLTAMTEELAGRSQLSGEFSPNAFHAGSQARATLKNALAQIAQLIHELDVNTLTERVINIHVARFDPLPAQPVAAVLNSSQDFDYHTHAEGVLHTVSDSSTIRLVTADAVVTLTQEQFVRSKKLLQRAGSFRVDDISESLSGDRVLLSKLMDARLICAAGCDRKL